MLDMLRSFYRLEDAIEKVIGETTDGNRETDLRRLTTAWVEYQEMVGIILDRAHGIER